ncbi:2-C-methyl-D-erythritol 2,4-cyclodiphosphate synthase [Nitrosomonas sp.]|uniref:2-C-methyl-D-erythritol 2,4-cyclodiphosphate synthase n=1 Tax=Nitrosomonas sp. TaxID=42353 RepID=UPI0025EF6BE4|nr:2-C-methyl-D-erythritol 2,4-cyclodiphosphate synthase [Nitrosomonas sp.]
MSTMRIGQGFDIHQLVEGRHLIIGGVTIPYDKGLLGHSDADVLLHAICDALLGAAALGDIGKHFSDSDPQYKHIDSRVLLRNVHRLLENSQYKIINIDATIIAQMPKMAPHISAMISNIAQDLQTQTSNINIKAKTAEHLGAIGRGEGIAAEVVCLIDFMERNLDQE